MMISKFMSVITPITVVSTHHLNSPVCMLSTTLSCAAGGKWRLQQGLAKHGTEYGPLQEIPDWSYADGRPAPLWPREIKRREKQKDLALHAMKLIAEMKDAKKTFACDKSSRPTHRFAQTDVHQRTVLPRFRVKNL